MRWAIDVLPLGWLIEGFTPKRKTIGSNRLALDDRWYTKHRVAPRLDLGTTLVTGQAIKIAEKIASFSVPAVQLAKDWVGDVCWIVGMMGALGVVCTCAGLFGMMIPTELRSKPLCSC